MAQSAEALCSERGLSKTVVPAESCGQQYLRIAALHWTGDCLKHGQQLLVLLISSTPLLFTWFFVAFSITRI